MRRTGVCVCGLSQRLLLVIGAFWLLSWMACAQSVSELLPAQFQQINSLAEITDDGYYLIGTDYEVRADGKWNKGFCLLTAQQGPSTLRGVEAAYPAPALLEETEPIRLWQFKKSAKGYKLYSPAAGKEVGLKQSTSSALQLENSSKTEWNLSEEDGGTFLLTALPQGDRALGLNWNPKGLIYFGAYKVNDTYPIHLRIYRKQKNFVDIPGNAKLPDNEARVALAGGQSLAVWREGRLQCVPAAPYVLQDASLAAETDAPQWICRHVEDGKFCLEAVNGHDLGEMLSDGTVPNLWEIINGYVATVDAPKRYMCYNQQTGFTLLPEEEVVAGAAEAAVLLPMGESPDSICLEGGVKILSGSWSANALAAVDWTGISELDLTGILLPAAPQAFSSRPEGNALTVVAGKSEDFVPASWSHVIKTEPEGDCCWLTETVLCDRSDWMTPRTIKVPAGMLTYHRDAFADGKWETLVLPFAAAVPKDFVAEVWNGEVRENGALLFEPTERVQPHRPMLIRYVGARTEGTVAFEVTAEEGMMEPQSAWRDRFSGTYRNFEVAAGESIYLLNAAGDVFVRASAGSHLSAFRAYLKMDAGSRVAVLHGNTVSKIEDVVLENGKVSCYSPDGRLLYRNLNAQQLRLLPRGLYIIGGRKYLK